jgi:hypothetical protein
VELSRIAIAVILALAVGVGGIALALRPAGLSEAAGVLPEPLAVQGPTPSPSP